MSAVLRVDDFPGTKPEEFWKHNLDNFKKFDAVLERHGIESYVLGVIPKYTTEEHIEWLSSNPRIEVALHGIEHDERVLNEFRDYETEESVYQKIMSAISPLKRCNGFGKILRYIPPHNVIDLKTCRALKRAGISSIMGGPGTDLRIMDSTANDFHWLYSRHPIWYGRSDELMDRDNAVDRIIEESNYLRNRCLTLHWTWEQNIGLQSLDKFMTEISSIFEG